MCSSEAVFKTLVEEIKEQDVGDLNKNLSKLTEEIEELETRNYPNNPLSLEKDACID